MPVKHLFVLMLENRSFDHLLGFADLSGTEVGTGKNTHVEDLIQFRQSGGSIEASPGAPFKIFAPFGPGHEFNDVLVQLCGAHAANYDPQTGRYPQIDMSGFVRSYREKGAPDPSLVMRCYRPEDVPVITTLAREFAVCDHWFSSIPGPTWPNRFFVHAASSAGLDDSPSPLSILAHETVDGYEFPNATIYDRLGDDWLVFHGDPFPCVYSLKGMATHWENGLFQPQRKFKSMVSDPEFAARYIFIEPHYGRVYGDYAGGTSQHPLDDITRGDQLIKDVYEAIRSAPCWNESALVITYDEHGGFYDHVIPPTTLAPGDGATGTHHGFDFKQLGVRVPAVVVSPLIPKGTIDHTIYDHSSVPATIATLFNLPPFKGRASLSDRDGAANTFEHLFSRASPRTAAELPDVPDPPDSGFRLAEIDDSGLHEQIDPNVRGFLYVAFLRQFGVSPNLAATRSKIAERYFRIRTRSEALHYLKEVEQQVGDGGN